MVLVETSWITKVVLIKSVNLKLPLIERPVNYRIKLRWWRWEQLEEAEDEEEEEEEEVEEDEEESEGD